MKGLALESIAYIVLALVSIFLIIGLVTGRLGPAAKSAYCKFLRGVKSILPMPSHLKTTMPVYCAQDGNSGIESHEIVFREPERVAYELAAYSLFKFQLPVGCWHNRFTKSFEHKLSGFRKNDTTPIILSRKINFN
jgi:hypothetical protein